MSTLIQSLRKKGPLFLLLAGSLMLAASISSTAFADTPACDGVSCANDQSCGTKCICNSNGPICLDNTEAIN